MGPRRSLLYVNQKHEPRATLSDEIFQLLKLASPKFTILVNLL